MTFVPRGFLLKLEPAAARIESETFEDGPASPLQAKWTRARFGRCCVHKDPERGLTHAKRGTTELVLLGHVYDPWTGHAGRDCLENLIPHIPVGRLPQLSDTGLWETVDQLSGRFALFVLDEHAPWAVQDSVGLQSLYFHHDASGNFWGSSHSQLLAEACGLKRDPAVDALVAAPFYGIGVRHLPGRATPFRGMQMVTANTFLGIRSGKVHRFFPREPHGPVSSWDTLVEECSGVLAESVRLLAADHQLAVSLSLGTDSRMTLAATRANARELTFFSYASNPEEKKDADGAQRLCAALGLKHEYYPVDVEAYAASPDPEFEGLLNRNSAGIRRPKTAEIAKIRTLLRDFPPGRMELKTPVSEIGRAIYCKKMAVSALPDRLTSRDMSNLYKRNVLDRRILKWTDTAFATYRQDTAFGERFFDYEEHDMFYWEHRNSQWAALANQDHDLIHDMTTILNNRRLLVNFLKPSLNDRISDRLHHAVIQHLWPEVLQVPLHQKTSPKARVRKLAERWFFRLNSGQLFRRF